jgi:uncharacterized coiled-coil DUF342 family protein
MIDIYEKVLNHDDEIEKIKGNVQELKDEIEEMRQEMKELREAIKEIAKNTTKINNAVLYSSSTIEKLINKINTFVNSTWVMIASLVISVLILMWK